MLSRDSIGSGMETPVWQACAELRRRLRAGEDSGAEGVAASFPSVASDPGKLLELVLAELAERRALGQTIRPGDWYARYPQWRDRLWLWFEVEDEATGGAGAGAAGTAPPSPRPRPAEAGGTCTGIAFGRYRVFEVLGKGGMGVVYRALDTALGRVVALKMIRAGALARPEDVERFSREARVTAKLRHPHIVGLYDIDACQGEHYLTMEFVAGGSLSHHRQRLADDPARAAGLVEKVARGVHHAHANGILHRDLKPGNILLDEHDEPRVSDFGLAKVLDAGPELTRSGGHVGTPVYMAPEQVGGRRGDVSPRTDVWALGVLLYELLTGRPPFAGDSGTEVMQQILTGEPIRPRALRRGLSRDLETVVLKCLEKDPARRHASAQALADDLRRFLGGEPVLARPASWPRRAWRAARRRASRFVAAAVLLLVALAGVGWVLALSGAGGGQAKGDVGGPAVNHADGNLSGAGGGQGKGDSVRQQVLGDGEWDLTAGTGVPRIGKTGVPTPPLTRGAAGQAQAELSPISTAGAAAASPAAECTHPKGRLKRSSPRKRCR
jgi:predicted Ser/Thr protein kinase